MSVKRGGLGRNLSALLSHSEDKVSVKSEECPEPLKLATDSLQPGKYQPRREMDDHALAELAESIKQQGLLQPLVVREIAPSKYEIIAGERRWRACQLNGMLEVPVIIRQVDDETAMALALIENLQREDLNAMDQARAMQRLTTEFSLTHQQVADLVCKSRTAVSNYLRLLHLSDEVRRMLEYGDLEMGHARCLLMLKENEQSQVAQWVVAKNLSVRETEKIVARIKAGESFERREQRPSETMPLFEKELKTLAQQLQTKVKISPSKNGKGKLVLHYDDVSKLEKMIDLLMD